MTTDSSRSHEPVIIDHHGDVVVVTLNAPTKRNALEARVVQRLETLLPKLLSDESVRCLVITGAGDSFCAGGDVSGFKERDASSIRSQMQLVHGWTKLLLTAEKPIVAAVNGAAAGGGFSLALLCDIVLASNAAYFQAAFPGLGAAPDLGLALTLPRAIGASRAKDILLTNRRVEAAEAQQIGITKCTVPADRLHKEALELAMELAKGPTGSFGLTKVLMNRAFDSVEEFFATEALVQAIAFSSREFEEGVAAFLNKRRPDFRKVRNPRDD